jgi:hypothetical protein
VGLPSPPPNRPIGAPPAAGAGAGDPHARPAPAYAFDQRIAWQPRPSTARRARRRAGGCLQLPARLANSLSNRETLTPGLAGPRSDPSSPQLAVGPGRSCRASLLPTTRQGHWDSLSLSGRHWSTARDEPHLFSDDSRPQTNWAQVPVDVAGLPSRTRPHAISKPHWRNHSQGSLRSPAPVWLPRLSIMKPGRLPDCAAPLLSGSVTQRG